MHGGGRERGEEETEEKREEGGREREVIKSSRKLTIFHYCNTPQLTLYLLGIKM